MLSVLCCLFMAGCKQAEIVYDHEQPQFEIRSNAILLELIVPSGTAADDEIFIFGPFNGETETTVTEQLAWKMEKAARSDRKWGIYLFPKDFAEGKSLADGFSFVSKKAGAERDVNGKAVTHTLDAGVGTRTNIWADRWAAYFSGDERPVEHDGYVVYVQDESGFADLHLYMYGDIDDLNGGWPGMAPTGVETLNGVEYKYFDIGADNSGLSETLIFSDNGSNQLADYGPVTFSENFFLHIKDDGSIEKVDGSSAIVHDGAVVYVLDGIGWGMSTTLYMWGDVDNLNGGWPGMKVGGTVQFGDYTYMYYEMGEANKGLSEHLIFSNNGAGQLPDYDGYVIGEDIYLYIAAGGVTAIADPTSPGDVVWFDPTAAPKEEAVVDLYLYNATEGLSPEHLYAWGSSEAFGGWPGQAFEKMDTVYVLGIELLHTTISGHVSDEWNLIFNNGADAKVPDYTVRAEEPVGDLYLKITNTAVSPLQVAAQIQKH